jgi:hypothetical protein
MAKEFIVVGGGLHADDHVRARSLARSLDEYLLGPD